MKSEKMCEVNPYTNAFLAALRENGWAAFRASSAINFLTLTVPFFMILMYNRFLTGVGELWTLYGLIICALTLLACKGRFVYKRSRMLN